MGGGRPRHRRGHDRLRHGHRQGRRPLRVPLQPAQEPRELRPGDRPRRPRRRALGVRAAGLPDDVRRWRTSPTATRPPARRSRAWSTGCCATPRASRSTSRSTTSPPATTCARWCCGRRSPTWSSRACSARGRRSTPATGCGRRDHGRRGLARFDGERGAFLRSVVAPARRGASGRRWTPTTWPPRSARTATASWRRRLPGRAGLVELQAAEARQRYTVLAPPADAEALVGRAGRALRAAGAGRDRAHRAGARAGRAPTLPGAALVAHFGEERAGRAATAPLPRRPRRPAARGARPAPIDTDRDEPRRRCVEAHPAALGEPRQQARFLCGITSPATTRARLTRDALFGSLRDRPFAAILAWCADGGS